MRGYLNACFVISLLVAAVMMFAGQTDMHIGFGVLIAGIGTLCLGISALLKSLFNIQRELKLSRVVLKPKDD